MKTKLSALEAKKLALTMCKEKWPNAKFKGKSKEFISVDITCYDGPFRHEIESLIGHMKEGRYNIERDMYEYCNDSPYTNKYLGIESHLSLEIATKVLNFIQENNIKFEHYLCEGKIITFHGAFVEFNEYLGIVIRSNDFNVRAHGGECLQYYYQYGHNNNSTYVPLYQHNLVSSLMQL